MDEKLYSYFKNEYEKITPLNGLKKEILNKNKKGIYLLAALSSSVFLVFIFSLIVQLSPTLDGIITNIVLP